jgi:hypothetical protein
MAQITKEAFEAARLEFEAAKARAAQTKFTMFVVYKAVPYSKFGVWGQTDEWALQEMSRVYTLEEAAALIDLRSTKPTLYVAKQMEVTADGETTDTPLWASDAMIGTARLEDGFFLDPWQDATWRHFTDIIAGPRIHIITAFGMPNTWKAVDAMADTEAVYFMSWGV